MTKSKLGELLLCVAESEKMEVPDAVTADFAYYRMRKEEYSVEERAAIANRARELIVNPPLVTLRHHLVHVLHVSVRAERRLVEKADRGFG